jgi:hypothetical protein
VKSFIDRIQLFLLFCGDDRIDVQMRVARVARMCFDLRPHAGDEGQIGSRDESCSCSCSGRGSSRWRFRERTVQQWRQVDVAILKQQLLDLFVFRVVDGPSKFVVARTPFVLQSIDVQHAFREIRVHLYVAARRKHNAAT